MDATASLSFATPKPIHFQSSSSNKITNLFEQSCEYLDIQSSERVGDIREDIITAQKKIIQYSNSNYQILILASDIFERYSESNHQVLRSALEKLLDITQSAYNILQYNFTNASKFKEQNKDVALKVLDLLGQANELFNLGGDSQNIADEIQNIGEKIANLLISNSLPRGNKNFYKSLSIQDLESLVQVKKRPIRQLAISVSKSDQVINIKQNRMPSCDLLTRYMIADNLSVCPVVSLSRYKVIQNNKSEERRYFLHLLYSDASSFNYSILQRLRNAGYEIYQDEDSFIFGISLPISYHHKMLLSTTAKKLLSKIYAKRITSVQVVSSDLVVKFAETDVDSVRRIITSVFKYDSEVRRILLISLQDLDAEQKISEYKLSYKSLLKMQNSTMAEYAYSNDSNTMIVLQILEDFFHKKYWNVGCSSNQEISKVLGLNRVKTVTSRYISGDAGFCEFFCANLSLWFNNIARDMESLVLAKLREDSRRLQPNQRIKLGLVLGHDAESDATGHAVLFLGWQTINGVEYIKFENPHGHVEYLSAQGSTGHLRSYEILKMLYDDNDEEVRSDSPVVAEQTPSKAVILFEQIMNDERHDYSQELLLTPMKICQVKKRNKIDLGSGVNFTATDAINNFVRIQKLQELLMSHDYYQFFCEYEIQPTFINGQVHLAIIDYKKFKLELSRDFAIKQSHLLLLEVISLLEYQSRARNNACALISLTRRIKDDSPGNLQILEQTVARYVNDGELVRQIIADARAVVLLD